MSIGYACLTVGVLGTKQRACVLKNVTPDTLTSIIGENLKALDALLDYNIAQGIRLFRISSDIIPFGSHPINTLPWWDMFAEQLRGLGNKARAQGMRLSMHPGQYTVLNSPDEDVVQRAVEDLRYHCRFLDALGLDSRHKMILHIGGVYGDKAAATERFIRQYKRLDTNILRRLVIENDDRQYTIADVLAIGQRAGIPVVFDNLHHTINHDDAGSHAYWIDACRVTWRAEDGPQKLHYSQQDTHKRPGSHSPTIELTAFLDYYAQLPQSEHKPDIMLEVKDKNLSAVKCIVATQGLAMDTAHHTDKRKAPIALLEHEWARYKYLVLERSPQAYLQIRELLKDKTAYPVVAFYQLIDSAMSSSVAPGNAVNAAQHVWSYVKEGADAKAHASFEKALDRLQEGRAARTIKRQVWNLALAQQQDYLLNSLYFSELYT
jgi:UV DNA damage endonuclease